MDLLLHTVRKLTGHMVCVSNDKRMTKPSHLKSQDVIINVLRLEYPLAFFLAIGPFPSQISSLLQLPHESVLTRMHMIVTFLWFYCLKWRAMLKVGSFYSVHISASHKNHTMK